MKKSYNYKVKKSYTGNYFKHLEFQELEIGSYIHVKENKSLQDSVIANLENVKFFLFHKT